MQDSDYEAKVQMLNLPMVSIMCRGREGSSIAMPMLAKVIAPDDDDDDHSNMTWLKNCALFFYKKSKRSFKSHVD